MAVDFNKLGCLSDFMNDESIGDSVCVCGFEKAPSAGRLIEFGDLARP